MAVINAMIDSRSSSTFIKKSVADKLKLYIIPKHRTIPLADNKHVAKIIGEVVINIKVNGQEHRGVVAEVIKNLCTDVIISKDRLRRVVFNFLEINNEQSSNPLQKPTQQVAIHPISNLSTPTTFGTVNIHPPPLFTHLSNNMKPIATKSRRQSLVDLKYMKEEVTKLHRNGIP